MTSALLRTTREHNSSPRLSLQPSTSWPSKAPRKRDHGRPRSSRRRSTRSSPSCAAASTPSSNHSKHADAKPASEAGLDARPTNSNVRLHKRLHTHSHHLVASRTEGGNQRPCGGFAADEGIGSGHDARSDALAWASRTTYCSTPSRELTRVRARVKFIKLWHPKPRRADRVVVDSSISLSIEEVCRVTAGPGFPDEVEPTRRNRVVGIQVSHWWARLGTGATRRVLLRAGRQGVARAGTRAGAAGERDRNRAHAHGAR